METTTKSARLDEPFDSSASLFGADRDAYSNHAYRVLNFAVALSPSLPDMRRKLEIACYFHDLGIRADVSMGLLRFGLPRPFVAKVRRAFPNRGFHRRLVELTLQQLRHHPLRPLPMFKW